MAIETKHSVFFQASQKMAILGNETIDLVVTSPPYPMIEMWDEIMSKQNENIKRALKENKGNYAFEEMHKELDIIWGECFRVLKEGGFLCINIGDATRSINGDFELYNNHSRIISSCLKLGFKNLPNIIWRKQTNAPNKFMGSGMLPCGAYVTLEHEWILIFRKGEKRKYPKEEEKKVRRESSFFWEERNIWFSDIWEIKGTKQKIVNGDSRERSASYPLSIPYRLINMYSQKGDTILDPFLGLGTTSIAAMVAERNSVGIEIDPLLKSTIQTVFKTINVQAVNNIIKDRFNRHIEFIENRIKSGKEVKYENKTVSCKVMTKQETDLTLRFISKIQENSQTPLEYTCTYLDETNMHSSSLYLF